MPDERLQQETPGEPIVQPWPEREGPSPGEPITPPWPQPQPDEQGGDSDGDDES
jgi:hypothetical protein